MSDHQNSVQSPASHVDRGDNDTAVKSPDLDNSSNADKSSSSAKSAKSAKSDSYVKLAMRNMVKKGSTSLFHFFLTTVGVIGVLLGLAIVFH
ncbi:hypothetical protein Pse7367_0989 [Thalassoporum mexicanum PCC 7367]|nr:DUF3285 domain-containing protein [Pseudanabaena sp. PCC 7367]AFY69288.1 hypothetical protein Pse7367_0989 [Pseudanabaena sp. PCC 7367]